jgi:hypothetical protein
MPGLATSRVPKLMCEQSLRILPGNPPALLELASINYPQG